MTEKGKEMTDAEKRREANRVYARERYAKIKADPKKYKKLRKNDRYRYKHDSEYRERLKETANKRYDRIKPTRKFAIYGFIRPSGVEYYMVTKGFGKTRSATEYYDTLQEAIHATER